MPTGTPMKIADKIDRLEAELAGLRRQASQATCAEIGRHDLVCKGGANCGCKDGGCSVPVFVCTRCGDCDYGENAEAREVRDACGLNRNIGEQLP